MRIVLHPASARTAHAPHACVTSEIVAAASAAVDQQSESSDIDGDDVAPERQRLPGAPHAFIEIDVVEDDQRGRRQMRRDHGDVMQRGGLLEVPIDKCDVDRLRQAIERAGQRLLERADDVVDIVGDRGDRRPRDLRERL
jgi:hypothetical protein